VVPRLAVGLSAYGSGDWTAAITALEPALAETVRIGGSRAQRDLIENTLLAAYSRPAATSMRAGWSRAHAERRPSIPVAGLV
jgi:hypothetical protein